MICGVFTLRSKPLSWDYVHKESVMSGAGTESGEKPARFKLHTTARQSHRACALFSRILTDTLIMDTSTRYAFKL